MQQLTAEYAAQVLDYRPETGEMRWKKRPESMFEGKKKGCCVRWNNRYAGEIPGMVIERGDGLFYRSISINHKHYLAHRLAWLITYGQWPEDKIDHRNGDGLDNRIENLQEATQRDNMHNQRLRRNSKSGICGVSWRKDLGKWSAYIRTRSLGVHATLLDAAAARKSAERGEGFSYRHGRAE
ncbi:HNH endonuclease signature motif containing protein [Vreelandella stevensii]|uniref:HNH endonuclease signature motif containing protein n=1 Tax=Vreelandella stevensii TaxID=502821 RepID=UPI00403A867C